MRIIQLTAENIKRLVAVEITPEGSLVQITGRNGQGKTSVLDSIWWALAGAQNVQKMPIRQGEKSGKITVSLGEKGAVKFIVERKFVGENSYLKVKTPDGAAYESPQRMLDKMLDALSFDPLRFMRGDAKDQFETLRHLVPISVDIDALTARQKEHREIRTEINREIKSLEAQALAISYRADAPDAMIDTKAILSELENVDAHNAGIRQQEAVEKEAERIEKTAAERVARLESELKAARAALKEAIAGVDKARLWRKEPGNQLKDSKAIADRLSAAEAANAALATNQRRRALELKVEQLKKDADARTAAMEAIETEKREAIAKAKMPIDGLSFGDGEVTFNGLPLDQASDAQQLMISTAIAAALNPSLRVLRIRDGSLLDTDAMRQLAEFAESRDFQIWIERVDSSGEVGIVMEDGHVKGAAQAAE